MSDDPPAVDLPLIAHDVLNRLGPILNAVSLLRMTQGRDPEPYFQMITRQAEAIRELVKPLAMARR